MQRMILAILYHSCKSDDTEAWGGGTSILKVTGTCRWTGYDFAVINIGTGYLNQLNWLLAGYSVYHRVASQGFPAHNVYDRPAIWAPVTVQYCDGVCI